MKKIRIGIDVDNVIVDFSQRFVEEFNRLTGKSLTRNEITKWNLKDVVDELYVNEIDGQIANELLTSGILMQNMSYKETAKETLIKMSKNELVEIVIITALQKELIYLRKQWFKEEFPNMHYELHFESNKSKIHLENPIDYLIDDGLHNLDDLSKYIPKENCICIEEPYNLSCDYVRVKTLKDAYEYILSKENLKEEDICKSKIS